MESVTLTQESFLKQVQSGVTLVDFWAPWCGSCQVQLPIVDQLADELRGQVTLAKVNLDEEPELAMQLEIRSIPKLMLFKEGKLVDTLVSVNSKDVLKEKILELAGQQG